MSALKAGLLWGVLFSGVLALLAPEASCSPRTTPPGADVMGMSSPGMSFAFLRWKEGLRVLVVDDVNGQHGSHGTGSTDNPVYTATVSAGDAGAGGYTCRLETTDGKSASCRINGKNYDLSKGALFVIKARGGQTEVHQLRRDLAAVPFDVQGCREAVEKDAEIQKRLRPADAPK